MAINVQIVYFDDKQMSLLVPEDEIQKFFEHLNNDLFYMNEGSNIGFWTSMGSIRYILTQPYIPPAQPENKEKEDGNALEIGKVEDSGS